jgi:hypothetical protein
MSFKDIFKETGETFDIQVIKEDTDLNYFDAPNLLREKGYRIKLETPTFFGTQIDLAKEYDIDQLKKDLEGFSVQIDGNKIFVSR